MIELLATVIAKQEAEIQALRKECDELKKKCDACKECSKHE